MHTSIRALLVNGMDGTWFERATFITLLLIVIVLALFSVYMLTVGIVGLPTMGSMVLFPFILSISSCTAAGVLGYGLHSQLR